MKITTETLRKVNFRTLNLNRKTVKSKRDSRSYTHFTKKKSNEDKKQIFELESEPAISQN